MKTVTRAEAIQLLKNYAFTKMNFTALTSAELQSELNEFGIEATISESNISHEQFMAYFKSEQFEQNVTTQERQLIFLTALEGGSDISLSLIAQLISNYSAQDSEVGRAIELRDELVRELERSVEELQRRCNMSDDDWKLFGNWQDLLKRARGEK